MLQNNCGQFATHAPCHAGLAVVNVSDIAAGRTGPPLMRDRSPHALQQPSDQRLVRVVDRDRQPILRAAPHGALTVDDARQIGAENAPLTDAWILALNIGWNCHMARGGFEPPTSRL